VIELLFRCGTAQRVDPDKSPVPTCAHCGTTKIARSLTVTTPRFTGCVSGPLAQTRALEPMALNLAETPLKLKDPTMTIEAARGR
jgi:hypothetical protein